jgi:acetolactate synthase-1/2/3 large subunit
MVTGVASALLDRAPLLAFTGALATTASSGTTHQALDLNALYQPIAKRSIALTPGNAVAEVEAAIAESQCSRQGPIHLSLPADVATSQITAENLVPRRPLNANSQLDNGSVARAATMIGNSQRPAVIAGLGAREPARARALTHLARVLTAPVAVLPKAKGVLSEDDPLFAGVLEMAGDDIVVELLHSADLLILVGVDPVEFDKPWRFSAPVVCLDDVPNTDCYYPADAELVGDMVSRLGELAEVAPRRMSTWSMGALAEHRRRLLAYVCPAARGLRPWHVVASLRRALPAKTLAACDVGAHKMLVGQTWRTVEPRSFFMANGLSSMGYAIPVATSLKLTLPERPVIAFVGDGGLAMYLGELETLVRCRADVLITVFVDGSLQLVRRAQLRRGVPVQGTSFDNPDFRALGRAFGVTVFEVESQADLARAASAAESASGVRLLAARVDGSHYRF